MAETVKVFVSYSWGVEEETKIVDDLELQCPVRDIQLIRDRNEMKHGDSIREFIDQLTGGEHVVTVFSKSYFKSKWCMLELYETWRKGSFQERTHPIIADDCDLGDTKYRLQISDHWEFEHKTLKKLLKKRDSSQYIEEFKELRVLRDIALNINDILNFAKSRLTTPLEQLQSKNYSQILDGISSTNSFEATPKTTHVTIPKINLSSINQETSVLDIKIATKLVRLEQQLDMWEAKLHAFKMELPVADGLNAKFSIQQRIKSEINPEITKINKEYARLLRRIELSGSDIDGEADEIVAEFIEAAEELPESLPQDLMTKLDDVLEEVKAQNKSATAKLKVTLPIIPLLASYELDLDTETFLGELWEKARGLLNRKAKLANP